MGRNAEDGGNREGRAALRTPLAALKPRDRGLGDACAARKLVPRQARDEPVDGKRFRHFAGSLQAEACRVGLMARTVGGHNLIERTAHPAPGTGGNLRPNHPLKAPALCPPAPAKLQPSVALARWIAAACRAAGRPGWLVGAIPPEAVSGPLGYDGALFVPRPPVCFRDGTLLGRVAGRDAEVATPAAPGSGVITPQLAEALRTGSPVFAEMLGRHEVAAARRLWAAALRDIGGVGIGRVARACGYTGANAEDTAKKAVARGRQTWRSLGAWPWVEFTGSGAAPPRMWRRAPIERGSAVDRSLRMWAGLPGWGYPSDS